jgi:hypothetical protein
VVSLAQREGVVFTSARPGARLSPLQDADALDFTQPIVSVSLGLPAVFVFGGTPAATDQLAFGSTLSGTLRLQGGVSAETNGLVQVFLVGSALPQLDEPAESDPWRGLTASPRAVGVGVASPVPSRLAATWPYRLSPQQ